MSDDIFGTSNAVVDADRFYTLLFSALEQTHRDLVACDSERVTVAFYSAMRL